MQLLLAKMHACVGARASGKGDIKYFTFIRWMQVTGSDLAEATEAESTQIVVYSSVTATDLGL
jgi:hypothetical protein